MSGALLRLAAEKIREEAGAATPGRWQAADSWAGANAVLNDEGHPVAICGNDSPENGYMRPAADRAHIAAWSPIVALAVADWLNASADHADATGGHCVCDDAALAVARTYLGAEVSS